jgi:hypothetical protein
MYSRNDGNINKTDLMELCPAVLYQMTKQQCHGEVKDSVNDEEEDSGKENPTRGIIHIIHKISSGLAVCKSNGLYFHHFHSRHFGQARRQPLRLFLHRHGLSVALAT